jgi:hypothetical protein
MPGFGKVKDCDGKSGAPNADEEKGLATITVAEDSDKGKAKYPFGKTTAKVYKPSKWDLKMLTPFCIVDKDDGVTLDKAFNRTEWNALTAGNHNVYVYKWGYNLPLIIALGLVLLIVLLLLFKLLHNGGASAPPPTPPGMY